MKIHFLKIRHDMKYSETKVTWILRLLAKFHGENDDATKQTGHLASFGVVFWKVGFITNLSITVPSSETFLVRCYSRRRISVTPSTEMEFHLMDANTPLNVELRAFIESHFKCTIMNVKLIFRLGFGVKSQNIRGVDPMRTPLRPST